MESVCGNHLKHQLGAEFSFYHSWKICLIFTEHEGFLFKVTQNERNNQGWGEKIVWLKLWDRLLHNINNNINWQIFELSIQKQNSDELNMSLK